MTPVVETVFALDEARFHLHTKVILRFRDRNRKQLFTIARVVQRNGVVVHVGRVDIIGDQRWIQIVIRHELAVALAGGRNVDRTELVIDGEVSVVSQRRERLGTVILEVAAFIIDLLQEEVVRVGRVAEQVFERPLGQKRRRITVRIELIRHQVERREFQVVAADVVGTFADHVGLQLVTAAVGAGVAVDRRWEFDHAQLDAVLVVVHRVRRGQFDVRRFHFGEIEVHALRHGDRDDLLRSVRGERGIIVMRIVPRHNVGVVVAPAPSVQVDADGRIGQDLTVFDLRGEILAGIDVLQFVVIVRRCGTGIVILGEIPKHRVDGAAFPADGIAFVIAEDKVSVMVDDIEIISLLGVVPDTGIDDDLVAIFDVFIIGNTDLFRRITDKIVRIQHGRLRKLQPCGGTVARSAAEVWVVAAQERKFAPWACELISSDICPAAVGHGDHGIFIRRIDKQRGRAADAQILRDAVHLRRDIIFLTFDGMEGPHREIRICDDEVALIVDRVHLQLLCAADELGAAGRRHIRHFGHSRGFRSGVTYDAVALSVEIERVVRHLRVAVQRDHTAAVVIRRAVEALAAVTLSQVEIIGDAVLLEGEEEFVRILSAAGVRSEDGSRRGREFRV